MGETSVYSVQESVLVGTNNTGEFLCTGVNSVGASLTASLMVQIKGKNSYHFHKQWKTEKTIDLLFGKVSYIRRG